MQVVFELPTADADHKTQQQPVCNSHRNGAPCNSRKSKNDLTAYQANAGTDKTSQEANKNSFFHDLYFPLRAVYG